jgi:hypothetical protein
MSVRQAICSVCGKPAGVGTAVVVDFGGSGRVHKTCENAQKSLVASKRPVRGAKPQPKDETAV